MQASRRTWRIGQVHDVDVHFAVYRDTMEHRAASLVGQKLAAAQLIYGDSVQGALVDQADSGHGFLAELARSVIERSEVADLSHLFRQVSMAGGNGHATSEFIGAELSEESDDAEISAGMQAALQEASMPLVISTRQMALF